LLDMLVTIVSEDEFGKAVAVHLQRKFTVEQTSLTHALERDWNAAACGMVAVCTDRPYFAAFEELDARLRRANLPLAFAYIKESSLIIGPLIVPGKSACYRCFQRRMLSHAGSTMLIERAVRTASDCDWSLKSSGMLSTTPVIAGARLARLARLWEGDFGRVTIVSLTGSYGQQIRDFRVQRVHGCDCTPSIRTAGKSSDNLICIVGKHLP
jgi:hypothetical protein